METKAKIVDINKNYKTGKARITFEGNFDLAACEELMLNEKDLRVSAVQWREKRSLDANAKCWVLINKLSAKLGRPPEQIYRDYIRDVGDNSYIGCIREKDVERLKKDWSKNGLGWFIDTFDSKIDGCINVTYYYGSSHYNTEQMSRLIQLVVDDCEKQGICTMSPEEIDRLIGDWNAKE